MANNIATGAVVIKAEDQSSPVLNKAADNLRRFGQQAKGAAAGGLLGTAGGAASSLLSTGGSAFKSITGGPTSILGGALFGAGAGLLGGGGIGAIAGAGAGVLTAFISDMGGVIDKFKEASKLSKEFGLPIEDIQTFQFAAMKSGGDVEAMSGGLRHLSTTLADAKGGSAEAMAKFAALGISLDDLSKMNTTEAMNAVASALNGMKDPADKVSAAVEIFGRGGAQLIPTLGLLGDNFSKLKAEGERVGVVMGEDAQGKIKELIAAQKELNTAWDGLVTTLTVKLAPAIKSIITSLNELASVGGSKWGIAMKGGLGTGMEGGVTGSKKSFWLDGKKVSEEDFKKANFVGPMPGPFGGAVAGTGEKKPGTFKENEKLLAEAFSSPKTALEQFQDSMFGLSQAMDKDKKHADRYALAIVKAGESLASMTGVAEAFKKVAPGHVAGSEGAAEALQAWRQANNEANSPANLLSAAMSQAEQAQLQTRDTARDILNFLQASNNLDPLTRNGGIVF